MRWIKSAIGIFALSAVSLPVYAQLSDVELRSALAGSIVRIEVTGTLAGGPKIGQRETRIGTGTIVSESGFIVTAKHLLLDSTGNEFAGVSDVKVFLSSDKSKAIPLIVKADGIRRDAFVDAALLKVPEPDEIKFTPATICNGSLKAATPVVAFGYPAGLSLSYKPGNIDSFDGPDNYWQTSISTYYGMSGGPVADKQAQVVGLVYGAQTASLARGQNATDIYTLVVPASSITSLLQYAGIAIAKCAGRIQPRSARSEDNNAQIKDLYAPLYSELSVGEANFNVFREGFNNRFLRWSPVRYQRTVVNGQERRVAVPMSDSEWSFWMSWVERTFIPQNRKMGNLIRNHTDLLVGGVLTPCMKALLLHFSAFDESYRRAKLNPDERLWQPDHGWPPCIGPEVEGTLARLTAARANGS